MSGRKVGYICIHFLKALQEPFKSYYLVAVAVRVIKIFGTKDDRFSTPGNVTKNECFVSSLREGGAEILSTEISDP